MEPGVTESTEEPSLLVADGEGPDVGIRTLTLNRPEVRNAFGAVAYRTLDTALRAADEDPVVRVVILTASGESFSAGADFREWSTSEQLAALAVPFSELVDALARFSKPLLAAVQGPAVGFGATLLGYADLVFASHAARFRFPFSALGTVPEAGSSVTIAARVGRQNAFWQLLASQWITAEEALASGLIWKLTEPDELHDCVQEHARVLAGYSSEVVQAGKRLLGHGRTEQAREAVERELTAARRLPVLRAPS